MKTSLKKTIKIGFIAMLALAFVANLQFALTNYGIDAKDVGLAVAVASGSSSVKKKYSWSFPACSGTIYCDDEPVDAVGIKLKCISGYDYVNCTSATDCSYSTKCPIGPN